MCIGLTVLNVCSFIINVMLHLFPKYKCCLWCVENKTTSRQGLCLLMLLFLCLDRGTCFFIHGFSLLCLTTLFFSLQSFTHMFTGLLFLTAVSDTHPDQFVYKTLPPSIQVDKSVDITMNSYLGLWPPEVAPSGQT